MPTTSTPTEAEAPPPVQFIWPQGTPVVVKQAKGKPLRTTILGRAVNGRIPCGGVVGGAAPEDISIDLANLRESTVADRFDLDGNLLGAEAAKAAEAAVEPARKPSPPDWPIGSTIHQTNAPDLPNLTTTAQPEWNDEAGAWDVQTVDADGVEEAVACEDFEMVDGAAAEVVEATLDDLIERPPAPTWPSGTELRHRNRPETGLTIGDPYWHEKLSAWFVRVRLAQGEAEVACDDWMEPAKKIGTAKGSAKKGEAVAVEIDTAKQQTVGDVVQLGNGKTMTVGEVDAVLRKEARMRELGQNAAEIHAEYLSARSLSHDLYERWKEKMKTLGELAGSDAQLSLFGQKGVGDPKEPEDPGRVNAYEEGVQARQRGNGVETCPYDSKMPDRRRDWQMGWEAEQKRQTEGAPKVLDTTPKSGAPDRLVDGPALALNPDALNLLLDQTEALSWTTNPKDLPKLEGDAKAFQLYERSWIVVDYFTADDSKEVPPGNEAFDVRPLWTQDEWDQLHGELGKPVETSSDPRCQDLEREHGLLAARRVKLGRSKLVIGPLSDRLLVLFPLREEVEPAGKDAAAGEGLSADDVVDGEIVDPDPLGVAD